MSKEEIKKLEEDIEAFEEDKKEHQEQGRGIAQQLNQTEQVKQNLITRFRQIEGKVEMLDDLISRRREKIKELKKSNKKKQSKEK